MGRILKAGTINVDYAHPIFIKNGQDLAEEEDNNSQNNQAKEDFAEEIIQALSPSESSIQNQEQNNPFQPIIPGQQPPSVNLQERNDLSNDTKQSRALAAIEAIKVKELEVEALKEQLKSWEAELRQKEQELIEKERTLTEELINRRKSIEAEASNTIRMAKEAANSTTQAAKAEAEAIRQTALAEQQAIREKAYNDGQKEGYSVGEAKGISAGEQAAAEEIKFDWNNLMKESEMLVNELQSSRMGIIKSSEEEILKLAIAFAKTIIKTEPLIQPEIVLNNISEAINKVAEVDKIVMRVNMRDKSMCEDHKNKFLSRLSSVSELIITEDPNLSPGGIKIETSVGTIDASIEAQTRELEKALIEKYNKSMEEQ